MANILYANNAAGTLAAGITNASASLTLNAGQGTPFPSPTAPQVFYMTLTDAATQTLIEIVQVTARAGDVFSIVRAQDGTSALSWNAGDIVSQRTIALELRGFENAAEGNFAAQVVPVTPSTTLGIVGTTLGDNANTGSVGEYVTGSASGVALTSGTFRAIVALVLSAGDWDVAGVAAFNPAGSTILGFQAANISTVSGSPGSLGTNAAFAFTAPAGAGSQVIAPVNRINLTTTTSVFLNALGTFSGGTCSANAFIRARRVR